LSSSTNQPFLFLIILKSLQATRTILCSHPIANTQCTTTPSLHVTQHSMVPPHHSGTDPVMTLCSSIPLHADHLTSIVHRSPDYAPLLDHPPNRGSQPSGPQRNGPFSTAHLQAHSNTCHLCHFCARHTHKFHSCCFVDYVFQRKSPRRWAWRCRRKQLTHVQRISLAGVVSRATCIGKQGCVMRLHRLGLHMQGKGCVAKIWKAGLVPGCEAE
jgi:hypothetical protein